jgi:hypothetical protein
MPSQTKSMARFATYYYNLDNNNPKEIDAMLSLRGSILPMRKHYRRHQAGVSGSSQCTAAMAAPAKINQFVKHALSNGAISFPNTSSISHCGDQCFQKQRRFLGLSSIEKTIMDLNKIIPSADMGLG